MLEYEIREIRLVFWDRILQGAPPQTQEIDQALLPFIRETDIKERLAFTLLRSCAKIARSGTEAMRRNLKVALLYWFGNANSEIETAPYRHANVHSPHVHEIVNRKITWREAAAIVGTNPNDYSARQRLMKVLQEECAIQWGNLFGEAAGNPFEAVPHNV